MSSFLSGIGAVLKLVTVFSLRLLSWFDRRTVRKEVEKEVDTAHQIQIADINTELAKMTIKEQEKIQEIKAEDQNEVISDLQDMFNSTKLP